MLGKQISNDLLKTRDILLLMNFKHFTTIEANNIIRNEAPPEEGTGDDSATDDTKGYL
jgi:hypothetical protein